MFLLILKVCGLLLGWYYIIRGLLPWGASPFLLKSSLQRHAIQLPSHGIGLVHAFPCAILWLLDMLFSIFTPSIIQNLQLFSATFLAADFAFDVWVYVEMLRIRGPQHQMQLLAKDYEYHADKPKMTDQRLHQPFQEIQATALRLKFAHHFASALVIYGVGWNGDLWFAYSFWHRELWSGVQHFYSLLYVFFLNMSGQHEGFENKADVSPPSYEKDVPLNQRQDSLVNSMIRPTSLDLQASLVPLVRSLGFTSAILYAETLFIFILSFLGALAKFEYANVFAWVLLLAMLFFGSENLKTMNTLFEKNGLGRLSLIFFAIIIAFAGIFFFILLRVLTADVFLPYWNELSTAFAAAASATSVLKRTSLVVQGKVSEKRQVSTAKDEP